ncbi:transcription factor bHLH18-like [Abrus precatorius]|uniref:Transcription factor bHLH18-like n=1 Tax=Abrus precatorius TaxID=3816 RepID=A0A8B8K036_ABRPR|nr:transcription factor bHLH18-like [Abrus precatorius]
MDESCFYSDVMNNFDLFSEHDMFSDLEQELKLENSVGPKPFWNNHSCSNLNEESTTLYSNKGNYSYLEEITGCDNTSLKQHDSPQKPLLASSMSYILSFEDSTAVPNIPKKTCLYHGGENSKEITKEEPCNRKSKTGRGPSQTQNHKMAERKRRENLTKMFMALSAIIPGLKKMDKASILNDAIDYVKYLKKRVKDLEDQNKNKNRKIESIVCFKSSKSINSEDYLSWTFDGLDKPSKKFVKVEARILAKDVFIRVMCEKQKDTIHKLLAKLEAHNLSIVYSNVLPIGNSLLNITSIAQMDHKFNMKMDDLVKLLIEDFSECCNLQQ